MMAMGWRSAILAAICCGSGMVTVSERGESLTYVRITAFSALPEGMRFSLLHSETATLRSSESLVMTSIFCRSCVISSTSAWSSSSNSDGEFPPAPIRVLDWRLRFCNSFWIAANFCRRKCSFCCLERDSSTTEAILLLTSKMDASLANSWVATLRRASASGVVRISVQSCGQSYTVRDLERDSPSLSLNSVSTAETMASANHTTLELSIPSTKCIILDQCSLLGPDFASLSSRFKAAALVASRVTGEGIAPLGGYSTAQ